MRAFQLNSELSHTTQQCYLRSPWGALIILQLKVGSFCTLSPNSLSPPHPPLRLWEPQV